MYVCVKSIPKGSTFAVAGHRQVMFLVFIFPLLAGYLHGSNMSFGRNLWPPHCVGMMRGMLTFLGLASTCSILHNIMGMAGWAEACSRRLRTKWDFSRGCGGGSGRKGSEILICPAENGWLMVVFAPFWNFVPLGNLVTVPYRFPMDLRVSPASMDQTCWFGSRGDCE